MPIAGPEISPIIDFTIEIPWSILLGIATFPLVFVALWARHRIREARIRRRYSDVLVIDRITHLKPR